MMYFQADIKSKKTQHPNKDFVVSLFVSGETKKSATAQAVKKLAAVDPEHSEKYMKPSLSEVTQDEYNEGIEQEPKPAQENQDTHDDQLVHPEVSRIDFIKTLENHDDVKDYAPPFIAMFIKSVEGSLDELEEKYGALSYQSMTEHVSSMISVADLVALEPLEEMVSMYTHDKEASQELTEQSLKYNPNDDWESFVYDLLFEVGEQDTVSADEYQVIAQRVKGVFGERNIALIDDDGNYSDFANDLFTHAEKLDGIRTEMSNTNSFRQLCDSLRPDNDAQDFVGEIKADKDEKQPETFTATYPLITGWVSEIHVRKLPCGGFDASQAILRWNGKDSVACGDLSAFGERKSSLANAVCNAFGMIANYVLNTMAKSWSESDVNKALESVNKYAQDNKHGTIEDKFNSQLTGEPNQSNNKDADQEVKHKELLQAITERISGEPHTVTPERAHTQMIKIIELVENDKTMVNIASLCEAIKAIKNPVIIWHSTESANLVMKHAIEREKELGHDVDGKMNIGDHLCHLFKCNATKVEDISHKDFESYIEILKKAYEHVGEFYQYATPFSSAVIKCYMILGGTPKEYEGLLLKQLQQPELLNKYFELIHQVQGEIDPALHLHNLRHEQKETARERLAETFKEEKLKADDQYEQLVLDCVIASGGEDDFTQDHIEEAGDKLKCVLEEAQEVYQESEVPFDRLATMTSIKEIEWDNSSECMKVFLNIRSLRALVREHKVMSELESESCVMSEKAKQALEDSAVKSQEKADKTGWEKGEPFEPYDTSKTAEIIAEANQTDDDCSSDIDDWDSDSDGDVCSSDTESSLEVNNATAEESKTDFETYADAMANGEIKSELEMQIDELNAHLAEIQPGEVLRLEDLPNIVYHGAIGYSSSNIKDELISSQYRHGLEVGDIERPTGQHFVFGNYFHTRTLEPEKIDIEYAFEPEIPEGAIKGADNMKAVIEEYNSKISPATSTDELKLMIEAHNASIEPLATIDDMKVMIEEHNLTLPSKILMPTVILEAEAKFKNLPNEFQSVEVDAKPTLSTYKKCIKHYNNSLPEPLKTTGKREDLLDRIRSFNSEFVEVEIAKKPTLPTTGKRDDLLSTIKGFNPEFVANEAAKKPMIPTSGKVDDLMARVKSINPDAVFEDEVLEKHYRNMKARGLISITQDEREQADRMFNAAVGDPRSKNWITTPGSVEDSYFWIDEKTGLLMKCRPDKRINNILIDLKSIEVRRDTKKAGLKAYLIAEIEKYGYHISAKHYLNGTGAEHFVWLFVNKLKGYEWSAVLMATPEMLELGEYELRDGIDSINDSLATGLFASPVQYDEPNSPILAELSYRGIKKLEKYREEA
ncbi:hypothetical protein VH1709_contig00011-0044 [Vibrio harveyi]|uniref:PD-(D/E)XK nuclease-like domain-containing protein n=1 Tax=Vibrio harveyi TaxID=669 RepID=UPI000D78C025|nr:PD-(D/E)XK nuclease-like domain-containing protein [Vibrio harveyi]GBK97716.1 hypothetical protein VH1709_contig00011-0044 [Vibrio harveyi]